MAPYGGRVHIDSPVFMVWPTNLTDGTLVRLLQNSSTLVPWTLVPGGGPVVDVSANTTVQAGDTLHFQLNQYINNVYDSDVWSPIITYLNPPLLDLDSDGVPDYLEDRNGNGLADAGETDWRVADNPARDNSSLKVFTPLK